MKKNILVILIAFVLNGYSQQDSVNIFQIEYRKMLTIDNTAKTFTNYYELNKFVEYDVSVFDKISKSENPNKLVNDTDDDSVSYFTPEGDNVSLVYKNYAKRIFYSKHVIAFKYFVVKDSLQIFDWKILNETKKILGYTCQLATMDYRGRKYKAWFTSDLPIGGPWKFDGLPGMILSLQTEKTFLSFEAISIKSNKIKLAKINNPFQIKKALTWDEFKKLYKKKAIALSKYSPEEGNNNGIIISRRGIETYIDENDTDYKADKEFEKSQGQGNN